MYIINCCFKLYLLTSLTLSTPTLAVLNDLSMAKPPLPINVTASSIDVTASLINNTAPFINVIASPINITVFIKVTAAINYGRDLVTLAKMYTEESKYSGEDDNFNYKLIIFNNLYNKIGIPQEAKIKGFLIILHGITLNFYYRNKATYITFNGIYNTIHNYFKGLEYKHRVLIKWNAITLKTVIIKSEGKSTKNYLQLLLNNLYYLQHSLNANLRNDNFLYNKLIVAY